MATQFNQAIKTSSRTNSVLADVTRLDQATYEELLVAMKAREMAEDILEGCRFGLIEHIISEGKLGYDKHLRLSESDLRCFEIYQLLDEFNPDARPADNASTSKAEALLGTKENRRNLLINKYLDMAKELWIELHDLFFCDKENYEFLLIFRDGKYLIRRKLKHDVSEDVAITYYNSTPYKSKFNEHIEHPSDWEDLLLCSDKLSNANDLAEHYDVILIQTN